MTMEETRAKVLIIEDEDSIRKFIAINLNRNDFEVLEASTGEIGVQMAKELKPQVVLLDIMLKEMDGFEACTQIREAMPEVIIIMLTARGEDIDKIMGLELGADDYMVKPFNPLELLARIRANLRKIKYYKRSDGQNLYYKKLRLDLEEQQCYLNEVPIELTPTEFAIVKVFMNNPSKAYTRDEILSSVWGENYYGDMKTVDVHIRRIREKIEEDPSNPQWITTVWGFGYRLKGTDHE